MRIEELKQEITEKTGIPATLLDGTTVEKTILRAKALLAYRQENEELNSVKTKKEEFTEWIRNVQNVEEPNTAMDALNEIEERAKGYITVTDGGNTFINGKDGRSTMEEFSTWFTEHAAFNPFKGR